MNILDKRKILAQRGTTGRPSHATPAAWIKRRQKYSARAFWLTLLCVSVLGACVLFRDASGGVGEHVARGKRMLSRDLDITPYKKHEHDENESLDCHLVHDPIHTDKCAYVRTHCPDEEAGLISYLEIYYCSSPKLQPVAFVVFVLWLGLLFSTIGIAASDFFCVNLSTIANLLGMSESLAGVTFLAFGNGSPDVFSTYSAMKTNSGSLAVGELIGAAGFITAVVAGSMALVRPFKVAKKSFVRDICFFIAAASFALVFLKDGELHLWECIAMVCFYLSYVAFVIGWHWWFSRKSRRHNREAAVRSQYVTPGGDEADVEPYHDEEGETGRRPTPSRGPSVEDFSNLERGGIEPEFDEDEEEANRERWLGELNSNMRIQRPTTRERRYTQTPIRPSLVGALEFRAVLHSLKKSRNIQSIPITLRRYSDDPFFTTAQQQNGMTSEGDPGLRPPYEVSENASQLTVTPRRPAGPNRWRAVSVNDIDGMDPDPSVLRSDAIPQIDLLGSTPDAGPSNTLQVPGATLEPPPRPPSPAISLTPPGSTRTSRAPSLVAPQPRVASPDRLAPPPMNAAFPTQHQTLSTHAAAMPSHTQAPNSRAYPKLTIPGGSSSSIRGRSPSTTSPFPSFGDMSALSPRASSLMLPPPSISAESFPNFADLVDEMEHPQRPLKWWPYKILPPPAVLVSTLFPTLYSWKDKNFWEKILGIISAPSVFLLTITLPVVEADSANDEDDNVTPKDADVPTLTLVTPASEMAPNQKQRTSMSSVTLLDPSQRYRDEPSLNDSHNNYFGSQPGSYGTLTEAHHANLNHSQPILTSPSRPHILQSPEQVPTTSNPTPEPKNWNRWLVIVQIFTAPAFVVLDLWANSDTPFNLLKPALISLLCSTIALLALLLTTTPVRPPIWRSGLCFLGFVVAIGWISTIANEVVGVLKWLGVVLNISDAILGLTIFAVGNSLGDLVADITVARLGFPVMALSACFGGPMLNILLGIGLSGTLISFNKARKHYHKHPEKGMQFKPYHLDVSSTLLISGATLLVTLVALLIAVPMRRWRMDRIIGWGLVVVWALSTCGNVFAEIMGWSEKMS